MVKRRRKKIREMGWGGGLMRYREIFEEIEEDREKTKKRLDKFLNYVNPLVT